MVRLERTMNLIFELRDLAVPCPGTGFGDA